MSVKIEIMEQPIDTLDNLSTLTAFRAYDSNGALNTESTYIYLGSINISNGLQKDLVYDIEREITVSWTKGVQVLPIKTRITITP